ncbi:MAG: hypothetical protein ACFFBI_14035 [Promethearchaeota archaeon]
MNKKRTIAIKDLRLRKIRDNLRSLIIEASKSVQHKLMGKQERLTKKIIEGRGVNLESLHDQSRLIEKEMQLIDRQINASIAFCPVCFKADRDMTYNPVRKVWYCTECYENLKKSYAEEGEPEEFP